LVDIIVDGGESAKSLNRPGMTRLLVRVDSGEVQPVIIAKLTLSVKDLCTLLGRFERRGVAGWRLFRQSPVLRVLYYAGDLCWMKATISRSTWTR
jgi:hypothetical protein